MPRRVKKCLKLCLTFGVVDVEKGVVRKLRKRATGESVFIWLLKEIFYIFCAYVSSPRFLSLPRPFCYLPHLFFASLFVVSAPPLPLPLPLPLLRMPKQKEREGFWFHFVYGVNYDSIWAWAGSGSTSDGLALGSMTKGNLVTSFGFLTSLRETGTGASPRVEEAPLKFESELGKRLSFHHAHASIPAYHCN